MKARVKATGEIISVTDNQLDFDNTDNSPDDYWTRLEHQYAGMAMQVLLPMYKEKQSAQPHYEDNAVQRSCAKESIEYAHALVEKYKKEK